MIQATGPVDPPKRALSFEQLWAMADQMIAIEETFRIFLKLKLQREAVREFARGLR